MFPGFSSSPFISWIPSITFATPGDLAISYTAQAGFALVQGRLVILTFRCITSSFTFSTASGQLNIKGVPIPAANILNQYFEGNIYFGGITKSNYTQITLRISPGNVTMELVASGSGQNATAITAADTPTGGLLNLVGSIFYFM
jgi:hypothetical protein